MKDTEIKKFLNNCRVDPNEKIQTTDDSWWSLQELIAHAFEVSKEPTIDDVFQEEEKCSHDLFRKNKVYIGCRKCDYEILG